MTKQKQRENRINKIAVKVLKKQRQLVHMALKQMEKEHEAAVGKIRAMMEKSQQLQNEYEGWQKLPF